MMISHPLPESHTAGCRSRGEDLCCLSRSVPAKPTSPQGLDFLEIVVSISYIVFDITKCIRKRRLIWLGELLRGAQTDRILYDAIIQQYAEYSQGIQGTLWMDVPPHTDIDELIMMSNSKIFWNSLTQNIPSHLRQRTIYTI